MKKNEFWATTFKGGEGYFHHSRIFSTREEARKHCKVTVNFKPVKVQVVESGNKCEWTQFEGSCGGKDVWQSGKWKFCPYCGREIRGGEKMKIKDEQHESC